MTSKDEKRAIAYDQLRNMEYIYSNMLTEQELNDALDELIRLQKKKTITHNEFLLFLSNYLKFNNEDMDDDFSKIKNMIYDEDYRDQIEDELKLKLILKKLSVDRRHITYNTKTQLQEEDKKLKQYNKTKTSPESTVYNASTIIENLKEPEKYKVNTYFIDEKIKEIEKILDDIKKHLSKEKKSIKPQIKQISNKYNSNVLLNPNKQYNITKQPTKNEVKQIVEILEEPEQHDIKEVLDLINKVKNTKINKKIDTNIINKKIKEIEKIKPKKEKTVYDPKKIEANKKLINDYTFNDKMSDKFLTDGAKNLFKFQKKGATDDDVSQFSIVYLYKEPSPKELEQLREVFKIKQK